jgi:DNA-binding PadR family transcriptional regulator
MAKLMRYGELSLVLLACLSGGPRTSYQLISDVESLFGGRYRPSTGTLYPAVSGLQHAGLVAADEDAGWALTPDGWKTLTARTAELAAIEQRTGAKVHVDDPVSRRLATFAAEARSLAAVLPDGVLDTVLRDAIRALRARTSRSDVRHA